ncbi:MAG TPA: transporter substrate-binding domain-containing protein, partial [Egibacteraceae bacterium]
MTLKTARWRFVPFLLVLLLLTAACTADDGGDAAGDAGTDAPLPEDGGTEVAQGDEGGGQEGGSLLQTVKDRGTLICGVNDAVPGFGFTDEEGNFSGFDIEFCKVIAAAVLGDAEAVEFRPLTAEQRFTALQSGEVDVLVRNTTWSASRD